MPPPRSTGLGVLHQMRGQHAQSEPFLTRALAITEKLLGLDHPDVALSVVNLAQLLVVQGRPEKAEPLYRRTWRFENGRWGHPIQRSRSRRRTLPMPCGNYGVQTKRSRWSYVPKPFARSGVEPATPSSVAYPLWQCTTSRFPSTRWLASWHWPDRQNATGSIPFRPRARDRSRPNPPREQVSSPYGAARTSPLPRLA